jgi:ELWxxDGT repeat protein
MPGVSTTSFPLRLGVLVALVGLAAAGFAAPVSAATGPYLVRDINANGSSTPDGLTEMGGKLYFSAKGGGKGRELWVSDGTETGTRRVRDIRPGSAGSNPQDLIAIGGLLFFSADSGNGDGRELFRSDGTSAGTWQVADINPGPGDSYPWAFVDFNGVAFFAADDGTHGRELWRSDGSTAGTRLVKDIAPGVEGTNPGGFVALPDRLIFLTFSCPMSVCTGTLYRTDGTRRSTKPLKDHDGELVSGQINWPVGAGGRMYFSLDETALWRSNGTARKTTSLGDIPAWEIVAVGPRVFFRVGGDLWKSDGSVASTVMVKSLPCCPYDLVDMDGTLFFFLDSSSGTEPWTSDGTESGTVPVGKQVQSDSNFATLDGILYFGGWSNSSEATGPNASPNGVPAPTLKLWRSDGTADGTYSVADTPEAHIRNLTVVADGVFFTADNGPEGTELWRYVP